MVYVPEHDFADSPSRPSQFRLIKGVKKAIKILQDLNYKIIIISNQPGIAKGNYNKKTFDSIKAKMHTEFPSITIMFSYSCLCNSSITGPIASSSFKVGNIIVTSLLLGNPLF